VGHEGRPAPVSCGGIDGGVPGEHYTPEGANQATIEMLLSSWHATLRLCQFGVQQPMVKVYGAVFGLPDEDLAAAEQYSELLASFAG
jgi:putative NADPH-quinone reductase